MPRRKLVKPTLHNQKYDRYIKVKYERIGRTKVYEMEIPAPGDIGVNDPLEPLIAKKLGCDVTDVWLIDKHRFEPYLVTTPRKEDE